MQRQRAHSPPLHSNELKSHISGDIAYNILTGTQGSVRRENRKVIETNAYGDDTHSEAMNFK